MKGNDDNISTVETTHRLEYEKAVLIEHGSIALLTAGSGGSKCDSQSPSNNNQYGDCTD